MHCNDYILQEFVNKLKNIPKQEQMDIIKNLALRDEPLLLCVLYKMKAVESEIEE